MERNQLILDQFSSELSHSSDHTKRDRLFYAKMFLDFAEGRPFSKWNKQLVNEFLESLRKAEYAPGTIRKVYGVVKRVFDAAKSVHEQGRTRLISQVDTERPEAVAEVLKAMALPGPVWDLGKRSAPKVESEDEVKPAHSLEEISAMIEAVKSDTESAAYLALSSIYGLRREELCRVSAEHFDFKKKTIYVLTAKGGERRNQLLCDDIIPLLKDYGFKRQFSPSGMSNLYHKICYRANIVPEDGSGYHNLRRFLDTSLVDIVGELPAKIFLRWKLSSSSEMQLRYYTKDFLEVDKRVLEQHPIVPLWR